MSQLDEREVRELLKDAHFYSLHLNENESYEKLSKECIDKANLIASKNIKEAFVKYSLDTLITFAEVAFKVPDRIDLSEYYLDLFFKMIVSEGHYYIRALLLKATLTSYKAFKNQLKAQMNVDNAKEAIQYVGKALDIIARPENKQKYNFLVYNASLCVYNIIRPFFRTGWKLYFVDILTRVDTLLEEVQEPNIIWRTRFAWVLFNSLYDAGKKPEAFKIFDKLWENLKNKSAQYTKDPIEKKKFEAFQETLFRHRVHFTKENKGGEGALKKDVEALPAEKGFKYLLLLQQMKSGIILEPQVEKE
jgi:hypothetical protein